MKKNIMAGLGVFFVFVVSVTAHIPAPLVLNNIALPPGIVLDGIEGTIWHGKIQRLSYDGQNLGNFDWQIRSLFLLLGKVEAQVRFGRGSDTSIQGKGTIGYSFRGPYAENFIASLPVNELIRYAPSVPIPVDITGRIELNLNSFLYQSPYCESGKGSLVWNTDSIGTPAGSLKLGPVIADLSCQDNDLTVSGEQDSDEVQSSFAATLNGDGSYTAKAWFKPAPKFPSELEQQLKWLPSPPDGDGKFQFTYQGRL
jgi:general secretion pathway protein N